MNNQHNLFGVKVDNLSQLRKDVKNLLKTMKTCKNQLKQKLSECELMKGVDFYLGKVKIDANGILSGLDDEIAHWKASQDQIELQLKQHLDHLQKYFGNAPVNLDLLAQTKTFRKLPVFGCSSDKPDFEWPTSE